MSDSIEMATRTRTTKTILLIPKISSSLVALIAIGNIERTRYACNDRPDPRIRCFDGRGSAGNSEFSMRLRLEKSLRQQQRMNTTAILLLVLIVVVIAVGAFLFWQSRRSAALKKKFGPEYHHAVGQFGNERKAEAELASREKRVRSLDIRSLTAEEQARFSDAWKKAQARFVDEPSQAAAEADSLAQKLMQERG